MVQPQELANVDCEHPSQPTQRHLASISCVLPESRSHWDRPHLQWYQSRQPSSSSWWQRRSILLLRDDNGHTEGHGDCRLDRDRIGPSHGQRECLSMECAYLPSSADTVYTPGTSYCVCYQLHPHPSHPCFGQVQGGKPRFVSAVSMSRYPATDTASFNTAIV